MDSKTTKIKGTDKRLDVEPILKNFLEYLYSKDQLCDLSREDYKDEYEDLSDEKESYVNVDKTSSKGKMESDVEAYFPYPIFCNFEKTKEDCYLLHLFPETLSQEELKRKTDIYENIRFYKGPTDRCLDFWRINLFQKGGILATVACLLLQYLKKQEGKDLYYGGVKITSFGTSVIKLKSSQNLSLTINGKSLGEMKDNFPESLKVLLVKREDGESFYIDYSCSTRGDDLSFNQNGFPCNIWRPCSWKENAPLKFVPSDTLSGEVVNKAFKQNRKEFDDYFENRTDNLPSEIEFVFVTINLYYLRMCEVVMVKHLSL